MAEYSSYLPKIDKLVAEPLPEAITDSLATQAESWRNTKSNLVKPIDGIKLKRWPLFNQATLGLRPHEFTILCGPTGAGKTTVGTNIIAQLGEDNVPYFVGSVETGMDDFTRAMTGVLMNDNPYRSWNQKEIENANQLHGNILNSRRFVTARYDSRVPHKRLLADLLYAHDEYGTKVAFIDNLNFLMDIKSSKDQIADMDRAVHDFVVFVKKTPVHVFMVMHPKKTDGGRVESEFDIKGSSTAVQEAANVILWNRLKLETDAAYNKEPKWCREMKFAKVRKNGRAAGLRLVFSIDEKSPRLSEEKFL